MDQKNLKLVKLILQADSDVQKSILRTVKDGFIEFLGEIALNILGGVLPLSFHFKNKLQPHAWFIREIGSKRVKHKTRRKLCIKNLQILNLMLKAVTSHLTSKS